MARTPDTTSPSPVDTALLDRARQDRLAALDRPALNALVRDLRARRDVLAGADDLHRRPIADALRRAVEEKRARQGRADSDEPVKPADAGKASGEKPKKRGGAARKVAAGPALGTGAGTDQPAAARAPSPPSETVSPGRAEREARRLANKAERAARQGAGQGRAPGKDANARGRAGSAGAAGNEGPKTAGASAKDRNARGDNLKGNDRKPGKSRA